MLLRKFIIHDKNAHSFRLFVPSYDISRFFSLVFQGTVWYSMFKWSIVANLTSRLGYTATSLGNHELDDGVGDLIQFVDATRNVYPNLACNLDMSKEPELAKRIKGTNKHDNNNDSWRRNLFTRKLKKRD